ncbi:MAG: branched-chain amino acid ABC transporter permease [Chloroflexi bacterium]|nr:MAG: branched-chain amino acid ABC transporter permease [Chloroflexota bacterium]MBL1196338.1 branched-chain amino acid ABC transporter permease [Chloroflexota bacterium]NOH13633.1 branched-chain amino acid ABC transporter permease [Chloroflexota bacterium]
MLTRTLARLSWVDLILRVFQIIAAIVIVIGIVNVFRSNTYTSNQWATLVFAGLAQGSIYALIALGYTLVYGILLMINFAHGEVYMAGAFSTVFLAGYFSNTGFLQSSPILAIIIMIIFAAAVSTAIALLLERIAYRPLRNAPRLIPLITAIGASFTLQYTFRGLYGAEFKSYPQVPALSGTVNVIGFDVPLVQLVVFFAAVGLMIALYLYVERTKSGKAMRAVSEDKDVARLMGIDIDRVIVTTFALGGALAGAAGVFNGLFRPQGVFFFMGFFPGIKAFTAAVLGGIGNIPGAMIGGLMLGLIESLGPNSIVEGLGIPSANQLKDAIAFSVLVLILIYRPQGIFGERLAEKKA